MGCGGPDGTRWDGVTCTGSAHQTSCDSVGMQTCVYAFARVEEDISCFGGVINPSGQLKVNLLGPLEKLGIAEGQHVTELNGSAVTEVAMSAFTPGDPATNLDATEPQPGLWSLTLSH